MVHEKSIPLVVSGTHHLWSYSKIAQARFLVLNKTAHPIIISTRQDRISSNWELKDLIKKQ